MKPRRILIFSLTYYPRFVGGAEVAVKEITDRIAPAEAVFDMITIGDGRGRLEGRSAQVTGDGREGAPAAPPAVEKIGNITVHRVFKDIGLVQKLLFPFAAFRKARSLHTANAYDAIWSIMANRAGFAALFFKRAYREVPFILTLQEGDPLEYPKQRAGPAYPLFKHIFRSADRITAISNFLADWARDLGAKCPIAVIPNAVDYDEFARPITADRRMIVRKERGFIGTDHILITTSRLVKKNGVDAIIQALSYLDASYKLMVFGVGVEEKDLLRLSYRLFGKDPVKRVHFLGHVPHAELLDHLKSADIFVRPSRSEGLGNSFLEAMAAGIPVIATAVGGIPDFLRDGETGLFCEVDNPRSIAQKVEKLIKDRESRDYIVAQARELVRRKYSWDKVAADMLLEMKTAADSARLEK